MLRQSRLLRRGNHYLSPGAQPLDGVPPSSLRNASNAEWGWMGFVARTIAGLLKEAYVKVRKEAFLEG